MSLDVTRALREGADRTASRNGAVLVAAVSLVALASTVAGHTLRTAFLSQFGGSVVPTGLLGTLALGSGDGPLAVPLPASLAAVVWVTALVVGESVRVVALRTFAGPPTDTIPESAARRRLGAATVASLVASLVARLAVAAGLVLLVVPGVVLAAGLLFVRARVAIEDEGVVDALTGSWALTRGDRLAAVGLVVAVVGASVGLTLVAGGVRLLLSGASPALGALVAIPVGAVGTVFGVAAVARAFVQLSGADR